MLHLLCYALPTGTACVLARPEARFEERCLSQYAHILCIGAINQSAMSSIRILSNAVVISNRT
jgi:hypothetical protein